MARPPRGVTTTEYALILGVVAVLMYGTAYRLDVPGGSLMAALRYRWRGAAALRFVHRWAGYVTRIFWLISNIASEIGWRIPPT